MARIWQRVRTTKDMDKWRCERGAEDQTGGLRILGVMTRSEHRTERRDKVCQEHKTKRLRNDQTREKSRNPKDGNIKPELNKKTKNTKQIHLNKKRYNETIQKSRQLKDRIMTFHLLKKTRLPSLCDICTRMYSICTVYSSFLDVPESVWHVEATPLSCLFAEAALEQGY